MIKYSEELACQRDLLIARCASQRNALTVQGQALVGKLTAFDIGLTLFERLKKNPAWIAGLIVGLVVIKPRRLLPMLETGLLVWQSMRALTCQR
jgi:hypothetical protein